MKLTDIMPNVYLENKEYECKGRLNKEESISWLKTVDGFANSNGGVFFLGVEDKTFKLIGYDQKDADKEKLLLHNEISNHFAILPSYVIEAIPYEINESFRLILKVTINEANKKPLIVKYQGLPMVFMRRDGFTNPATEEEIRTMVLTSDTPSFDKELTNIDFNFNDYTKYVSFYRERTNKDLTVKELEAIKFIVNGKLSNGAYLFSDSYQGNRTKVVCSYYRGTNRGDDAVVSSNSFVGNLIDSYHFIIEFVTARMNRGFVKLDDRRIDVDAYPSRALFEAIINALAHRDYLLDGTQINVDMFSNRLVISSPGSLFEGDGVLRPTYDLTSFSSKRRNEVISDAFVIAKAMEAKGTGLEKIASDYSSYDKTHQPFIFCKNNTFNIVLPDLTNEQGVFIDDDSIYIIGTIEHPTRFDLSVLSYCYMNQRSMREITDHLRVSNSSFFKTTVIDNLLKQEYLFETKVGNKSCFSTNSEKIKFR